MGGACTKKYVSITISGEDNSGKSTIYSKILNSTYQGFLTTQIQEIILPEYKWNLSIVDLASGEKNIWSHYLGGKDVIIYVIDSEKYSGDVSSKFFYENVMKYVDHIKNLFIIVNKIDVKDEIDEDMLVKDFKLDDLMDTSKLSKYKIIKIKAISRYSNDISSVLEWVNKNV